MFDCRMGVFPRRSLRRNWTLRRHSSTRAIARQRARVRERAPRFSRLQLLNRNRHAGDRIRTALQIGTTPAASRLRRGVRNRGGSPGQRAPRLCAPRFVPNSRAPHRPLDTEARARAHLRSACRDGVLRVCITGPAIAARVDGRSDVGTRRQGTKRFREAAMHSKRTLAARSRQGEALGLPPRPLTPGPTN